MLGFSTTGAAGSGGTALAAAGDWTYSYTTRGGLSSWPTVPVFGQSPQASAVFANGVTNQSPAGPSTTYQSASWDSRMGVMTGNTTQVRAPIAGPTLSYGAQYDAAGRLISAALSSSATPGPSPRPGQTPTPAPAPTAEAGTYDAENHALDGGLITWGPNGHPIVITNGTSQTLHWNGNQILFSTRTIGGTVQVDDIKIGMEGDLTPVDAGYKGGLTFYDRGPDGTVMGCHNATGTNFSGIGGGWTNRLQTGASRAASPCLSGLTPEP